MMELELKKMYDTVASIHDEMFYLRERYKINDTSSTRVNYSFSFSPFCFCFSYYTDLQFDCSFEYQI